MRLRPFCYSVPIRSVPNPQVPLNHSQESARAPGARIPYSQEPKPPKDGTWKGASVRPIGAVCSMPWRHWNRPSRCQQHGFQQLAVSWVYRFRYALMTRTVPIP